MFKETRFTFSEVNIDTLLLYTVLECDDKMAEIITEDKNDFKHVRPHY